MSWNSTASQLRKHVGRGEAEIASILNAESVAYDWGLPFHTGVFEDGEEIILMPDFRIDRYKVVIEIDGGSHRSVGSLKWDSKKDRIFHDAGYEVLRIPDVEAWNVMSYLELLRRAGGL